MAGAQGQFSLLAYLVTLIGIVTQKKRKIWSLGLHYCHSRSAPLKLDGKAAHATTTVFLTYLDRIVGQYR